MCRFSSGLAWTQGLGSHVLDGGPHVSTSELVVPSAHPSLQPKRQIVDRFSRFLHSSRQKDPILYNGRPFPQTLPIPRGIWTPPNMIPRAYPSQQPKRYLARFSRFCTDDHRVSLYTLQWDASFPLKIVPSHGGSGPHLIHSFLCPPESSTQTHLDRFIRFCRAH